MTKNRVGEIYTNKNNTKYEIICYNNKDDVIVKFLDEHEYITHTDYQRCKNGNVINPYDKIIYGVGYKGETVIKKASIKNKKSYAVWYAMLKRCYDVNFHKKEPTYKNCTVCDEWLCYANFEKWFNENYYELVNERICLDKDILFKNNKLYSPQTCCLVPQKINSMFTKSNALRNELPIGVTQKHKNGGYQAIVGKFYLGTFNTIEEAFKVYKKYRENLLKQVADGYKDIIPKKVYDAIYNYKVEIND